MRPGRPTNAVGVVAVKDNAICCKGVYGGRVDLCRGFRGLGFRVYGLEFRAEFSL